MLETDLHAILSSSAVLAIGTDEKILDCSLAFLNKFSLHKVPAGAKFNTLFDTRGEDIFTRHLALQPVECLWRESGRPVKAVLTGGSDGFLMMFEEPGDCIGQTAGFDAFSMLINNMQEGMSIYRVVFEDGIPVDYILEDINLGCEKILNLKREDVAGKQASLLFKGSIPLLDEVSQVVSSGTPRQFERYIPHFGKHFWISITPWGENRFGVIFSDLTQTMHSNMLQNTLSLAAGEMSGAYDTAKLFNAASSALKQNGFESMLLLTDSDMRIKKTYLSMANAPRVYHDESCLVLSGAFLQAAYLKDAIYIGDFGLPPEAAQEAGLSERLKGIAAPLIVNNSIYGVFVILSPGLNLSETAAVKVFVNLMAAAIERSALIQSLKRHIDELTESKQAHELAVRRLNMASAASSVGFWEYDFSSDRIYLDETARQIFSLHDDSIGGTYTPWDAPEHDDDCSFLNIFKQTVDDKYGCTLEYRVVCADGAERYVRKTGMVVNDESGEPARMIGSVWDITERKHIEQALEAEKEMLSITLQSIGEGVVVTDNMGKITAVNEAFEQLCGYTQKQACGFLFEDIVKTISKGENLRPSLIEKTLSTGKRMSYSRGVDMICKDSKTVSVAYNVSPIRDGNAQIIGTVTVMRDITEEKKKQTRIDYLVYHDALTEVYNRRYFEQIVKKIDTEQNLPLSVINCDVNGLKLANDAFGHIAGDKLLTTMASVLQKACRSNDIVIRSGGDEFIILMPGADEITAQRVCAEIKILSSRTSVFAIDCSISVGWATKRKPEDSLKAVINKAEAFMYRNKSTESPRMRYGSIQTILQTMHEKHTRERLHCRRVCRISIEIAKAMKFSEREIEEMSLVGRMHDIGKVALSDSLLVKPDKLTDEEWVDMKRHPEVGFRILSASAEMAHIAKAVLAHHERYDGSGYPNGLKGGSIPITARILAVADAYEAMTSERPYRKTKTKQQALEEIASLSGTQFDPDVADVFIKLYKA